MTTSKQNVTMVGEISEDGSAVVVRLAVTAGNYRQAEAAVLRLAADMMVRDAFVAAGWPVDPSRSACGNGPAFTSSIRVEAVKGSAAEMTALNIAVVEALCDAGVLPSDFADLEA